MVNVKKKGNLLPGIVVMIIIILIIIFLIIGRNLLGKLNGNQEETTTTTENLPAEAQKARNPSQWSKASDVSNPDENKCKMFIAKRLGDITPTTPTSYNIGEVGFCQDVDTIYARRRQHTCQTPDPSKPYVPCYKMDGSVASAGETEMYYEQCTDAVNKCEGSIKLISFPNSGGNCLEADTNTNSVFLNACNPANLKQRFRVIHRTNPLSSSKNSGNYLKIFMRDNKTCLQPSTTTPTVGTTVNLGSCSTSFPDLSSPGFIWQEISELDPLTPTVGQTYDQPQQIAFNYKDVLYDTSAPYANGDNYLSILSMKDGNVADPIVLKKPRRCKVGNLPQDCAWKLDETGNCLPSVCACNPFLCPGGCGFCKGIGGSAEITYLNV